MNRVYSVSKQTKAIDAFHLIVEKNVSAIAVVEKANVLYTSLSAKDIKESVVPPFLQLVI